MNNSVQLTRTSIKAGVRKLRQAGFSHPRLIEDLDTGDWDDDPPPSPGIIVGCEEVAP